MRTTSISAKYRRSLIFLLLALTSAAATTVSFGQSESVLTFSSSDTALARSFKWASQMALHYKGAVTDPVGPWYESALPPRSAFCMRDVSHQSIGGEILGLKAENKNMLSLFVKNISEGKDWCTYWEMNKYGKPAPEDYRNDTAFWYNLTANFDLMTACWRLYLWTGDSSYISGKAFRYFFDKTVHEYINRWVLQADSLRLRPTHPNAPASFNMKEAFSRCRGLPSYSEGVHNIKMGVDLVAAIFRGLQTYASILDHEKQFSEANLYREKATAYQREIENNWWDNSDSLYYTYYSDNHKFGKTEGETFLLWFDALRNGVQKTKTIEHLLSKRWNVENSSYLPLILYKNGYPEKAYEEMMYLSSPATARREYPEVSFGVVEAVIQGLMGIEGQAPENRISTCYRSAKIQNSTIKQLPILGTFIDVEHNGPQTSSLINKGNKSFTWRAEFAGNFKKARVGKKTKKLQHAKDANGGAISFLDIPVGAGDAKTVKIVSR